jgi:putative peptidoglycan lipid II flippase
MATGIIPVEKERERPKPLLGGFAALAESAWMGFPQSTEVLDALWTAPANRLRRARVIPRRPRVQWRGLLTREFSVAEASFILMVSFFLSAGLGAVRQILFNAQFGIGVAADAYYAAFRLPDTLFSLIAGGALSSAMIPVLLGTVREDGEQAGEQLINLVMTTMMLLFAVVVLVVELFTPFFVNNILAPGFDAATSQLAATLTRIMLIQSLVLAVGSVLTAVLNSRNQFLLTGLAIISHNVALITGILVARFVPGVGIYGPTVGVVAGSILQLLIQLPGILGRQRLQLVLNFGDRRLREIGRLLAPNGLSVGVNYAGFIADTAFASQAIEAAALPAMYNAWLLVGLPIALLGQAVGQATFPRLAGHAEAGEWREMRQTLFRSLGVVIGLAIPALLGLLFLGRFVIRILFERGEFNAAAGDLTYTVLIAYAVALPAYVGTEVIARGLVSLRDTRTPLATNILQLIGRITIMSFFISSRGILAIPIALAVTATLETLLLGTVLLTRLNRRMYG